MTLDQTQDAGRYVVDRGWSVHIGRLRIAGWHRCYAGVNPVAPEVAPTRPRLRARTNIGVGLFCLCTLTVTALVGERVKAGQPYMVTLAVPPAIPREAASRPRPVPAAKARHAAASDATVRPDVAAPPAARAPLDLTLGSEEADDREPVASSRAAAMKTALLSGDMQEWQDRAGGHGFVVAGPLQPDGDGRCRALAVLTRSTNGDTVEQRRECLR